MAAHCGSYTPLPNRPVYLRQSVKNSTDFYRPIYRFRSAKTPCRCLAAGLTTPNHQIFSCDDQSETFRVIWLILFNYIASDHRILASCRRHRDSSSCHSDRILQKYNFLYASLFDGYFFTLTRVNPMDIAPCIHTPTRQKASVLPKICSLYRKVWFHLKLRAQQDLINF